MKRKVAITTSVVKYTVTPSQEKKVRLLGSQPASRRLSASVCVVKSRGANVTFLGGVMAFPSRQDRFQFCVAG